MAVTLLPGVSGPISDHGRHPLPLVVLSGLLVPVQSLPLWWRRRQPAAVVAIVTLAFLVKLPLGLAVDASSLSIVLAVYAASVYGSPRVRPWVAGGAIALVALAIPTGRAELPGVGLTCLVAWVAGDYFHGRRQYFEEVLRESHRQAAENERLRIARELHDVVAHNVSAIAIQAAAARVGRRSADREQALGSIEGTARDTLAELNRLLGVLRKPAGEHALQPQPGLGAVDDLLKVARGAGLEAHLHVTGSPRPLPAALDLSAYRIVQEAVTNAVRHAHASRIDVDLDYGADAVVLTVSDDGAGAGVETLRDSTGHGLVGMRERVGLFGGELELGTSAERGFRVHARLPLPG